jgi:hypothetical protein
MSVVMSVKHDVTWDDARSHPSSHFALRYQWLQSTLCIMSLPFQASAPCWEQRVCWPSMLCVVLLSRGQGYRCPEFVNPLASPIDPALGQSPITVVANIGDT